MSDSIGDQQHAKLTTRYISQKDILKSGNDQREYSTIDRLLESGSDTFIIRGYAWVIGILTKIKVTEAG